MSIREIVSDDGFLGWPALICQQANRQIAYLYLKIGEEVSSEEKEDGRTIIRGNGWIQIFSAGLEPVIIRRLAHT